MLPLDAPVELNFLDTRIVSAVQSRLSEGVGSGIIERDRLFRNLLSSQPACFNLFGPFVAAPNRLLRWVQTIDEDAAVVTGVRFEWAPPRDQHFDGGSAFDAFVTYETGDARPRFVGVECKYAENLASSSIEVRDVYKSFTAQSGLWADGAADRLNVPSMRQFWLNTLLAQSLAVRGDEFDAGTTVVVSVSSDMSALQAVNDVRAELVTPDKWLRWMPYETVLAAIDDDDDWRTAFVRRYLDFSPVQHLLAPSDPRANGSASGADTNRAEAGPLHGAALLIRSSDGSWAVPSTSTYGSEQDLRDLLAENPSIIPGVGDPAVAAVVELGVPRVGRIDVVIVESSGAITVVEAKLAGNADMRRTVVGQVFAYAAGLASMDLPAFDMAWTARCGRSVVDSVLGDGAADEERTRLLEALARNLAAGRFRLALAVDELTDELRMIVGYLARHLDIDVVALELAYASHDGMEVLVPRTYGTEPAVAGATTSSSRGGSYRSKIAEGVDVLATSADDHARGFGSVVRQVLESLEGQATLWSSTPEMLDPVVVAASSPRRQPAMVITTQRTVGIRVCFGWCTRLPRERLEAALAILESHPATAPAVAEVRGAEFKRRPMLPFNGVLDQPGAVDAVVEALRVLSA